jgi:HEAT repeat protein
VAPIENAVTAAHGKAAARADLEKRLLAALQSDISRDAKDFVCRMLTISGSAAAVPALASLLADEYHSHMARYALERISAPEAAQALRDAIAKLNGKLKIGVISSIGSRRDASAVPALKSLLNDPNATVARAAAVALGAIGSADAAKALQEAQPTAAETKQAAIDAQLACAEALLADSKAAVALGIYKSLAGDNHGRLVRLAATRGMLSCANKNA